LEQRYFWRREQLERHGNHIWTVKRRHQTTQNPPEFDRQLNRMRERMEGAFNELQNVGRNLERLLAKHMLKVLLRRDYNIDIVTFSDLTWNHLLSQCDKYN